MKSKRHKRSRAIRDKSSGHADPKRRSSHFVIWLILGVFSCVSVALAWRLPPLTNPKPTHSEVAQRVVSNAQIPSFDDLSAMSEHELETQDIAVLNLRSATSLPGAPQDDVAAI